MIAAVVQRKGYNSEDDVIYYTCIDYQRVLDEVGIQTLTFNNANMADFAVKHCDFLLVTGGADVNPFFYGALRADETAFIDNYNDELDLAMIAAFAQAHKPILGICRGLQIINVYFGGTLYQHKPHHSMQLEGRHEIIIRKGSFLADCYHKEEILVNSLHHQGIEKLAEGFQVCALSADGVIEAICKDNIYAVQWHPEMMHDLEFFNYFKALIG